MAEKNHEEIVARIKVGLDQKSHIAMFLSNWISSITGTASLKALMVQAEKHKRTRLRAQELRYQQQAAARAEQTVDVQKGKRGRVQPMEIDQIQQKVPKEGKGGAKRKVNQGRNQGQAKDWVKTAECHYCHKVGHLNRNCFMRRRRQILVEVEPETGEWIQTHSICAVNRDAPRSEYPVHSAPRQSLSAKIV